MYSVWAFLEQVGGAAVECGKFDLAEVSPVEIAKTAYKADSWLRPDLRIEAV